MSLQIFENPQFKRFDWTAKIGNAQYTLYSNKIYFDFEEITQRPYTLSAWYKLIKIRCNVSISKCTLWVLIRW